MEHPNGFIDIHSHILPGVDDGSESMEETVKMLKAANDQQIETIIATPHFIAGEKNPPVEELRKVVELVQAEALKINKNFRILLGNELYYSDSILGALKEKKALTLADSRYVLVEFSVREAYDTMFRGFGELIRAGYIPVLAHVERYRCLMKKEYLIEDLIELGCYIQMNSHSLIGNMFHSEAVSNRKLVNQGLVHFVGSDSHDSSVRVPCISTARKALQKKCDERLLHRIFEENPFKVLENSYI